MTKLTYRNDPGLLDSQKQNEVQLFFISYMRAQVFLLYSLSLFAAYVHFYSGDGNPPFLMFDNVNLAIAILALPGSL